MEPGPDADLDAAAAAVARVRRFNRLYTKHIGVLREGYLDSRFSLTQVRILHEIANRGPLAASELARDLGIDPGYLSRLITEFSRRDLLARAPSGTDRRRRELRMTAKGRAVFASLDARASAEVAAWLDALPPGARRALESAMDTIEAALPGGARPEEPSVTPRSTTIIVRDPRPGDLGWIVHRHGAIYAAEYGWDATFEALVAEIVAGFLRRHDPRRERVWIAERDGAIAGSVMLVARSATVAQLRILLVEPDARGLGIGGRLVEECIAFARRAGYRRVMLWTMNVLVDAARIYARAGFHRAHRERTRSFGHDLVAETWERDLRERSGVPWRPAARGRRRATHPTREGRPAR